MTYFERQKQKNPTPALPRLGRELRLPRLPCVPSGEPHRPLQGSLPRLGRVRVGFSQFGTLLLVLLILLVLPPTQPAHAQDVPLVYEHFNTDLTLHEDGVLHVRMVQQIRFDDVFSGAYYAIPVDYSTSINNIQLWGAASEAANYELDTVDLWPIVPNYIENNGNEIVVDWNYPPTKAGDVRLFVLEYDAYGVVWVYPDQDYLRWQAVNDDRSGVDVEESVVTLTLPDIIPMDQVTTTSEVAGDLVTRTGQTLTFTAQEPLPNGTPFDVAAYFPHGLMPINVQEWQRVSDGEFLAIELEDFHADLTINADGTLNVHEDSTLTVEAGALHQGFRTQSLQYIDQMDVMSVTVNEQALAEGQGDCTGCYVTGVLPRSDNWVYLDPDSEQVTINEDSGGVYNIDWYTPLPVQPGGMVSNTIDFQADGVLRVNDENQLLTWQVVPDYGQPVRRASLRLVLPPGVDVDDIVMEAPREQGAPQLQPDGSLLYQYDGPVVPNAWQIALTLPANATSAEPPVWQQQHEDVMAQADAATVRRARTQLILRVLGILALVGALLAAIYGWMRWGRRKVKETLGGYVSEPPSQQSPAMVSYLVDRKASEQGILGSIFYLAWLKLLEIDLDGEIKLRRIRNEPLELNPRLTDAYGGTVPISRHLQALFDQVLVPALPLNQWVALDSIGPRLRDKLPEIYALLGSDVQKFFINIPGSRSDAIPGFVWTIIYGTLLGLISIGWLPWYLGFIIGFVALAIFVGSSAIQSARQGGYSDAGAVEADKWRRFKTYLQEIKKFGDQAAAQEIIDRYFGYAVAFGIEKVVLAQATEMGVLRPIWMPNTISSTQPSQDREPLRPPRQTTTGTGGFPWSRPRPAIPTVAIERPTFAGMSEQLGESLSRASRNLGSLLGTAAGDAGSSARTVVLNSNLRRREMEWKPNTPVSSILDDIMRQSLSDARAIQAREIARREAASASSSSSGGGWDWGSGSSSSSSSRSSGGFGHSSSSSSSFSSSSRSSSSSSSSSRSGGGGRSGFR